MSPAAEDPRCPECGEPIGQTATYCMHCSADLTEERAAADADGDGAWDVQATDASGDTAVEGRRDKQSADASGADDQILDPDGLVDNSLTVVVGIAGGIVVGLVGTIVLAVTTGSGWALLFGLVAWLGSTAYLVRRRTVQGAISRSGYSVAVVLALVPVVSFSPFVDVEGGLAGRGETFLILLIFVAIPAVFAAVVGFVAGRFVPDGRGSEG